MAPTGTRADDFRDAESEALRFRGPRAALESDGHDALAIGGPALVLKSSGKLDFSFMAQA